MAVDETLLNSAVAGEASLRFYQWSRPTVSLGHFQAIQQSAIPERFAGLEVVRRPSGGGAILHDRELTYSCALPATHPLARNPSRLYELVHEAIIDVFAARGIESTCRGASAFANESFLCFARGDARDVVVGKHKIVGSAQRRRQGAVLQHGSILLACSEAAPEFPGILEIAGIELTPSDLIPLLTTDIATRIGVTPWNENR
jgi:lipoate-protein ligase A